MKRRICISSDDGSGSSGSMPCWAGKDTKLDTLLEQLIDSVLLMNNKVEGLSNRVNALEQKVNEESMLGRKERTEFMNEVKMELAKLKEAQEQEQTVFVGSHLVSKLSNLQKLVGNELPVAVDIASSSKGLDVLQEQPNGWGTHLNVVQQPNKGVWTEGWKPWPDTQVLDCNYKINITRSWEDHWSSPGENVTKVNVGIDYSWDDTPAAYGVIARDHLAEFKGCQTGYFLGDSLEVQARAYLDGVEFAVKNELDNVVIEGDAQNIVEYLNDANHLVPRCIGYEIVRIRELASSIPFIKFRFIKESANMAANTLASYAKSNSIYRTQLSSPPPIITSLLDADSNCSKNKENAVVDRD
ncbi:hypothetical protein MKW98_030056 [Papaver atlanticum]|uniref:RNase H type-1 domain-containing protein n=1 Tax=Papaver atlanticum TaxID=357466 RepID=A0AAD4T7H3_9MAGN|nr:hypothetical protein MKW98_030056 [Papaver atlanticum]